jgi:GTPase
MSDLARERLELGNRAILAHIIFPDSGEFDYEAEEFSLLAQSAGAEILDFLTVRRKYPEPKYLIGGGKVEEIAATVTFHEADLVIFNHDLSPAQERNIEKALECRVLDRTGLILDIFASRARSFEGKLQVELAQLEHLSSRLVRGWSHLERQKGGIGLRGPGETQLESDRRMIQTRIKQINRKLDKVRATRELGRKARQKAGMQVVSLVGYTNAGKSTLFNRLSNADVFAEDLLFATLDPTLRKLKTPLLEIILADTVGFVSKLPHKLVSAFRSTLEETFNADLLIHVIDAASDNQHHLRLEVLDVLHEIGADTIPILEVFNKIDLLDTPQPRVDYDAEGLPTRVWLSAQTGLGVDALITALEQRLASTVIHCCVRLAPHEGNLRSRLFHHGRNIKENYDNCGFCHLELELDSKILDNLLPLKYETSR